MYTIDMHFIWERWRAKSVLLGFEHVDHSSLGISNLKCKAERE